MGSRDPARFANNQPGQIVNTNEDIGVKGLPGDPGPKGDQGVPGTKGDQGIPGSQGATYPFSQPVASTLWVIDHSLGKFPSVSVIDSTGRKVRSAVSYTNANQIILTFSAAFAGTAYLN
jgi:hypothetical protein